MFFTFPSVAFILVLVGKHCESFPIGLSIASGVLLPLATAPGQVKQAFEGTRNQKHAMAGQYSKEIESATEQSQQNFQNLQYSRSLLDSTAASPLEALLAADAQGASPEESYAALQQGYADARAKLDTSNQLLNTIHPELAGEGGQLTTQMPMGSASQIQM
jgi:hypothetical protein